MRPMPTLGRGLQVLGLLMTGYAAVSAFWVDFSEAAMFTWGLGGFAIFFIGSSLRGRSE
jgi:hypothetical protein